MWTIRLATAADADEACQVLRRSITELCVPDHGNDPTILQSWLANKTPERVAAWISVNPDGFLAAIGALGIGGVATVSPAGEILLNYVSPMARFQSVSSLLIAAMEARAKGDRVPTLYFDQHGDGPRFLSKPRLPRPGAADRGLRRKAGLSDGSRSGLGSF